MHHKQTRALRTPYACRQWPRRGAERTAPKNGSKADPPTVLYMGHHHSHMVTRAACSMFLLKCFSLGKPLTPGAHRLGGAMPKRASKKSFKEAQDASWVQETYKRLDDVAAQLQEDDSAYPSSQAWMRAGTQDLEALRSGQPWSAASSSSGAHRFEEETSGGREGGGWGTTKTGMGVTL